MRRGLIYIDDTYAEFGYFPESKDNIRIIYEGSLVWGISYDELKDHLGFDYLQGSYVIGKDVNQHNFPFGRDAFPYNLDKMVYNAKFEEHLFKDKQNTSNLLEFRFINELPYTFGLEFETAGGYLPQHRLYELGLIPLRDGSISGIEFTTVVLQGNMGLNLLKQQVEALDACTIFDKDCSLHIHFGNFKLNGNVLLAVNNLFRNSDISQFLPELTFSTHLYKTNEDKNYCEFNDRFRTFEEMYGILVGRNFYGDLKQPHPKDIAGTRKWNIRTRYKAVNFINALCYDGPKTIEYRMLRPTYNFNKIKDLFTNDEKISGENSAAAPSPLSPDPDDDSDDNNDNNLEDNKKYREKTRNANANANDRKQVDSIAKKFKINRREFGDFIEDTKQSMGRKPSDNFTYKELEILAKEFMELQ